MTEYAENIIIENQEVVAGDYPNIELVKEYFDITKPEIDWNPKDNLIVCLQFSECLLFPERLFQNFIVERQGDAFWEEKEIEVEVEEESKTVASDEDEPDSDDENFLEEFKKDDRARSYESKKTFFKKRYIWSGGLYIQEKDENNQLFQIEIEKKNEERQIVVRCSGKSTQAKDAFDTVIRWFKNHTSNINVLVVCTCPLCQQKGLNLSHRIRYEHLENLSKRFEPKVQCYSSGAMQRLDVISTVPKRSFKTVFIHVAADDGFCEIAKTKFFPKEGAFKSEISDRKQAAGSVFNVEYERETTYADVVIVLLSANLTGGEKPDEELARKMAVIAESRFTKKECLMLLVIVRDPSTGWENCSPFDNPEIPILNQIAIADLNNDKAWSEIGNDIHKRISHWLKTLAQIND